ncbi:class F sortase [Micromonospora yangpuensis]|uniref:Sortase family protein n=1 Tax=Micromonospora yangpuensis TaxID=683228 RepID=A0A1C6V671_9ACTN|nr:hypothetical protein GCM10012279_40910 [Micromonospora yangpuensis]SCL61554.1 Sortase family protein [Micromonospora yangpuensis]
MAASRGRTRRAGRRPLRAVGRSGRALGRLVVRTTARLRRVAGQVVTVSVSTTYGAAGGTGATPRPPGTDRHRPTGRRPWPAGRSGILAGRSGPGAPVLVVATLMVLVVAVLGVERVAGISVLPDRLTAGLRPPPKDFPVLPASPPVGITIPKIDVAAPVHAVGVAPDGTIGVPEAARAQEAAWYDQGPTPGQYGPAVIVGHVDTHTGPAVFHQLKLLRAGDRVEVTRQDRSRAVFEVESVERFDKERFPADEIFGDFSRPYLRLITCGGRWVGGPTGYADNVVVFASLVDAEPA